MSAGFPPTLGQIDGIPATELLDGLGSLHHTVVVTDPRGRVLWGSRDLIRALGRAARPEGLGLACVCQGYLGALNHIPQDSAAERAPYIERAVATILEHLEHRGSLRSFRIDPSADSAGNPGMGLEISAFGVDSHTFEGTASPAPRHRRLYVSILRPAFVPRADTAAKRASAGATHAKVNTHFERVLDGLPEATLTIDASGFITYANPDAVALLESSLGELIDAPVSLYFPDSALGETASAKDVLPGSTRPTIVKSAKTHRSLVEFAPGGRTPHFVEVASRPLEGPEGTSVGRILQLRDATSHQNLTERLKQKITSLESYVHTVSHDLRSPLVSLLGFTRLMKDDFGEMLGETGRRFLDRIEQAGSNMNTLTQDLLELSTQSQPGTSRKAVDPLNVLLQIRAEIKPRLEEQGIELWLPPAPSMLQCDRTQLYQVFSNLIVNALQHMGPCEAPRIAIEIQELQGERVIVVRDNGRGIETSAHAKIFDAFQTLSRDASTRSTGVGLSIVKKIALSYQGRVWVESEPGHGAAFFVSLKHS